MGRPIERRAIVKGAAWSLPVIAAAVAVPASTASTPVTGGSCLRFIGTNLTGKSLKVKVQNQCEVTARNVVLTIAIDGSDQVRFIPLGDIPPHGHAPTEHVRDYQIPAGDDSVAISARGDNTATIVQVMR